MITGVSLVVRMLQVVSVAAVHRDTHNTRSGTSVWVSTHTHNIIVFPMGERGVVYPFFSVLCGLFIENFYTVQTVYFIP